MDELIIVSELARNLFFMLSSILVLLGALVD